MGQFLTRCLGLISLWLYVGCTVPRGFTPLGNGHQVTLAAEHLRPPFDAATTSLVFKSTFGYGKKFQQSGLLALKQMEAGTYRAVFMTTFGSTLFDLEFGEAGMTVHRSLELLNRPLLLKVLEQDLELLLSRNVLGQAAIQHNAKTGTIYRLQQRPIYYQMSGEQLVGIHRGRAVSIRLSDYQDEAPQHIDIEHYDLPLRLALNRIK